ncbi:MAG: hypothetical protein WCB27_00490 [Thermoguttaceae bacterium]
MIFIVGAAVALPHWEKGWQWNCDPNRESATGVASYNGGAKQLPASAQAAEVTVERRT